MTRATRQPARDAAEFDALEAELDARDAAPKVADYRPRRLSARPAPTSPSATAAPSDPAPEPEPTTTGRSLADLAALGGIAPVADDEPETTTPTGRARMIRWRDLQAKPVADTILVGSERGEGWLHRGDLALLTGPTGIGKTSFVCQWVACMASGADLLGYIEHPRPLQVLYIQGESSERKMERFRDSVLWGDALTPQQKDLARDNVTVLLEKTIAGVDFWTAVPGWIEIFQEQHGAPADVLIIDPLFAYAGCDLNREQKEVSAWIRQGAMAAAQQHNIGILCVHHTVKPQAKVDFKNVYGGANAAYSGTGSGDIANAARASVHIQGLGGQTRKVFMLVPGKEGDALGLGSRPLLIRHGTDTFDNGSPVYAWHETDESDPDILTGKSTTKGRPRKETTAQVRAMLITRGAIAGSETWMPQTEIIHALITADLSEAEKSAGERRGRRLIKEAEQGGLITRRKIGPAYYECQGIPYDAPGYSQP
jgi:hypothetical protein